MTSEKALSVEKRLNALIPGPWNSLGAISGFGTGTGVYHRWRYRPLENEIEIEIEESSTSAATTSYTYPNAITPAGYQPIATKRAPAAIGTATAVDQARIVVNTNGTVQIFGLPTASYSSFISAHFTYPLDT